jgi:hypothetical protein
MRPQMKAAWATMALAGLLLVAPGCVIRRGFVVQFDWSLTAHRTGCRHQWFKGRCRACNASDCGGAACSAADSAESCESCGPRCRPFLGRFLQSAEEIPPPAPEPPGPSNFHPVPTKPIYGHRSEQPDAIESPMERLAPAPMEANDRADEAPDESTDAMPDDFDASPAPDAEETPSDESSARRVRKRTSEVRPAAWEQVGRKKPLPVPQCKSCEIRFR